jgi:hypothetical protein
VDPDKRSAWLKKLDAECPYQVVLPRRQLTDDSEIVNFLLSYAGKFDMYKSHCRVDCLPDQRGTPRFCDHASNRKASRQIATSFAPAA